MDAYGGGWTVIQHRNRGYTAVNFNTTWNEYKRGFGNVGGNYWLGNDAIHRLTTKYNNSLYIRLRNTQNVSFEVQYSVFSISNETDGYRLSLGEKTGTIGDAFRSHLIISYPFYTFDNDNSCGCAFSRKSGWWYQCCNLVNLNAPFFEQHVDPVWNGYISSGNNLFLSQMLIRRKL
ncbi:angiopoietin-related protein 7-like [Saccostrea cucullata]|uniref:angiopoietin-related protein 7-like n=1 Tax=Saccostrea cuccullata TaxID=36930 RepID=UPI002ED21239